MKSDILGLVDYIDNLQSRGRYTFTYKQASEKIKKSQAAFSLALHRLVKKGRIKRIRAGFYIIVPIEYQSIGSLPASWFIDVFMQYLGAQYYVALLSAAEIHGASHQQVIAFQVMTNKAMRDITVGQVRLEFHYQKTIPQAFLQAVNTETGKMWVSSPELTVCDLIKYMDAAGQIHNVATILVELNEKLSVNKLMDYIQADLIGTVHVQRLGYLLDFLKLGLDTHSLQAWVNQNHPDYRPLVMGSTSPVIEKNKRWHILVNEVVEPDV
jgi:predicted transcriptional regulator of viral defense system